MITLAKDCLVFRLPNGEAIPFSAEMISIELIGETSQWVDSEVARHAAKAVFHYFKSELGRQSVTTEEFAQAMEKVLRWFKPAACKEPEGRMDNRVAESDLCRLAREASGGGELLFFPRLRRELQQHLQSGPRVLRFRGLRACVKELAGARRWTTRCRALEEQIVSFLRECAGAEREQAQFALVVE